MIENGMLIGNAHDSSANDSIEIAKGVLKRFIWVKST